MAQAAFGWPPSSVVLWLVLPAAAALFSPGERQFLEKFVGYWRPNKQERFEVVQTEFQFNFARVDDALARAFVDAGTSDKDKVFGGSLFDDNNPDGCVAFHAKVSKSIDQSVVLDRHFVIVKEIGKFELRDWENFTAPFFGTGVRTGYSTANTEMWLSLRIVNGTLEIYYYDPRLDEPDQIFILTPIMGKIDVERRALLKRKQEYEYVESFILSKDEKAFKPVADVGPASGRLTTEQMAKRLSLGYHSQNGYGGGITRNCRITVKPWGESQDARGRTLTPPPPATAASRRRSTKTRNSEQSQRRRTGQGSLRRLFRSKDSG